MANQTVTLTATGGVFASTPADTVPANAAVIPETVSTNPSGDFTATWQAVNPGSFTITATAGAAAGTATVTAEPASTASSRPHVFVVMLENLNADQAYALPYISTLCKSYGCAYNYSSLAHPSGPNYLGLVTGVAYPLNSDTGPQNFTQANGAANLGQQLTAAGIPWGAYLGCRNLTNLEYVSHCSDGSSDLDHDPWIFPQDAIANAQHIHNLEASLSGVLSEPAAQAPNFIYIGPGGLDTGDDGSVWQMDTYLSTLVPQIVSSPAFRANGTLVITWDESAGRGVPSITNPVPYTPVPGTSGGQVGAIVIHQGMVAGQQFNEPLDHFSLLRSIETAFGLPLLAGAQTAPRWTQLDGMLAGTPPSTTQTFVGAYWSPWGTNPTITRDGYTATGTGTGNIVLSLFDGPSGTVTGAVAMDPVPVGNAATGLEASGQLVSGTENVTSITLTSCGVGGRWSLGGISYGTYDSSTGCASLALLPNGSIDPTQP